MKSPLQKIALTTLGAVSFAYAMNCMAQEVPAGALVLTPNDLKWSESPRAPGVQAATLVGDPRKPGPYIIRAKYPPNTINRPHHHPGDEEITVLSGTLYFGRDLTMEPGKTMTLPAGSFYTFSPGKAHFGYTEEETIIQLSTVGPWALTYVNPKDDPRQKTQ